MSASGSPRTPLKAWQEYYRLTSPGQFAVEIRLRKMFPGATWELVSYGGATGQGWSRVDIAGVPVLVVHGVGSNKVQPAVHRSARPSAR